MNTEQSHPCPTCDDKFETAHGMKVHHKLSHGESLAMVDLVCENCGDGFTAYKSWLDEDDSRGRFCSNECYEDHHRPKVTCGWCTDTFRADLSRVERHDVVFCSGHCELKWRGEKFSGQSHPQYERESVECTICEDSFTRIPARTERSDAQLCSMECFADWCSTRTGEDNPRWRGGYVGEYGPEWPEIREEVIQDDSLECQDCGISRDVHVETYGFDLDVHHIVPLSEFDQLENAHERDNLTTLCRKCHNKQ